MSWRNQGTRAALEGPPENPECKLYVGNLDAKVTEYQILKLFCPFGTIVREEFKWHTSGVKKGEPRGFCFLEYSTKEEAMNAQEKMNGKLLQGRPLVVRFANEQVVGTSHGTTGRGSPSSPSSHARVPAKTDNNNTQATADAVATSSLSIESKILAIKNKLKQMEKDSVTTPRPAHRTYPSTRFQPYLGASNKRSESASSKR
jgi:RNA recognition motif-containing protein